MTSDFYKIVIYILNQKNITIEEFALLLGYHTLRVRKMLEGNYNFKLSHVVRIEMVLDVKIIKFAGQD